VLKELGKLMEAKKLTPVISQTFPMADVVQAQHQIATRHTRGKIVSRIADEPAREAGVEHQTSNIRRQKSDIGRQTSNITHQTSHCCSFAITSPEWSEWDERHRR
jgi:hypothetical protein